MKVGIVGAGQVGLPVEPRNFGSEVLSNNEILGNMDFEQGAYWGTVQIQT